MPGRLPLALLMLFAACADYDRPPRTCDTLGMLCVQEDAVTDLGLSGSRGASGDLDGDGRRELVTASVAGLSIVWEGRGQREYQLFSGGVPDVAIGDVDADGDLDVVFVTAEPATLRVLENRGDRQLAERPALALTGRAEALWLGALADDGSLDAIVAASDSGHLSVITGGLAQVDDITVGREIVAVEAGDLNGDDRPDIVAIDRADASIHIALAQGAGFAAPRRTATGINPRYLQLYDHDGDGALDVLTHGTGREVWFHPGDGAGGLGDARGLVVQASASPGFMAHRDEQGRRWLVTIDGDKPVASRLDEKDLVVARTLAGSIHTSEGLDIDGDSALVRGTGVGQRYSLAPAHVFTELWHGGEDTVRRLAVADLDGDGEADLVSVDGDVTIRRRLADGTWGEPWTLPMEDDVLSLVVADVTGDGVPDLVVGDRAPSVIVAVGVGDGTFTAAPPTPVALLPGMLYAGLATGDEPAAVAVSGSGWPGVEVLRFDATGALAEQTQALAITDARTLTSADVDGDGDEDLIVFDETSTLSIVPRTGDGWGPPSTRSLADLRRPDLPDYPLHRPAIVVGDIDLDGRVDAVLVAAGAVVRLLDIGADPPPAPRIDAVDRLDDPDYLALGDIDGDGLPDLVTSSRSDLRIVLFGDDGELRPQPPVAVFVSESALHVDPADGQVTAAFASGRGLSILRPDLALALERTEILEGGPHPLRRLVTGDIDADGNTDIVVADGPGGVVGSTAVLWGEEDGAPRRATWQADYLLDASAELAVAPLDDRPGDDILAAWRDGRAILSTYKDGALQQHSTGQSPSVGWGGSGSVGVQARADGRSDVIVFGVVDKDEVGVAVLARGEDGGLLDEPFKKLWSTLIVDGEWSMTIADFDGDGYGDIAVLPSVVQVAGQGLRIVWGDRERTSDVTAVLLPIPASERLTAADLDGDGAPELLVDGAQGVLRVAFKGREASATVLLRGESDGLLVADLQDDGQPDLLRIQGTSLDIVAYGARDDTSTRIAFDPPWQVLRAAHLDGDDLLDLVGLRDGAVVTRLSAGP